MKKLFTLFLFLFACALTINAIPVKSKPATVTQSDGTQLTIVMRGDEVFHYRTTLDGVPVQRGADGNFYYAKLTDTGYQLTAVLAHNSDNRSDGEEVALAERLKQQAQSVMQQHHNTLQRARTSQRLKSLRNYNTKSNDTGLYTGERRGLVILVNYQDLSMVEANPQQAFNDQMNLEGYNEDGNTGSVHDYFYEQSYGQFNMVFDVVGPFTVSKPMAYYGDKTISSVGRAEKMVVEACQLADEVVDFSKYDWNNDGEAEMVYVVYAGYGASSYEAGAENDAIWPHEATLTSFGLSPLTLDGVKINRYACSNELAGTSGTKMEGIGTACHEFSHCFGLPDFYDTNYVMFGMGEWSPLDQGINLGDGFAPCGYTSYERMACGWLNPTELSEPTTIEGMQPLAASPEAYIVYNDANHDEYYLLENRQLVNSDQSLETHGLLVLHVDYDQTAWAENTVNNDTKHQRCSIIAADNDTPGLYETGYYDSHLGDPYPGSTGNTALTDTSVPAATLFNANANGTKFMSKPITDISESADGLISFNFMGGSNTDGILSIKTTTPNQPVRLYTTDGRYVVSATPAQLLTLSLPSGIYIVKGAERVSKIIIK